MYTFFSRKPLKNWFLRGRRDEANNAFEYTDFEESYSVKLVLNLVF